jgi:hypothetical protein
MKDNDTDGDGLLTEDDFINFYTEASKNRKYVV